MDLSIIIVNYKSRNYLKKCLQSIFLHISNVKFEIIIVNNDKEKFSKKFFKLYGKTFLKKIKIIEVNENVGFGRGCNLGSKNAKGKILCFLNPDTEIVSKKINKLLSKMMTEKKIGIMGVRVIEKNEKIQKWIAGENINLKKILKNNLGLVADKKIWYSRYCREVAWVSGVGLFIKKKLFKEVNGFDEKFFLYFEDVDLCKRVQLMGYKIIYYPKFIIKHLGGKSAKSKGLQKREYYKSQDYYFRKWFGIYKAVVLKIVRFFHF